MSFKITSKDKTTKARTGILATAHGKVKTPFFMPVATRSSGKYINTDDYKEIGTEVIITNALINYLKPGLEIIEAGKQIHNFMNFKGVIFTDCGGFQMSRSFFEKSSKKGLHFRSPFNNSKHIVTPAKSMEMQVRIGADVAMMLDNMPPVYAKKADVKRSLEKTHRWAVEDLESHQRFRKQYKSKQLLFGICQGALYNDLREESAKYISSLKVNGKGFDGIAIGGLAIGEKQSEMVSALDAAIVHIPENKPRYLMGVGNPSDILKAISRGVDMFDSIYPTKNARHGTIFTFNGKIDACSGKYSKDFTPLEKGCRCHTCRNYSKAYLHHLIKINEPIGKRFLQIHNLYFMQRFIERIRKEIRKGTFEKFKNDFEKKWDKN